MIRVEIKNFQSIANEVVEIDGFTAIVGKSNIGKSAVVRAINSALTGSPVESYVRHDEKNCVRLLKGNKKCKCFCSVRIVSEGFDLLWEKGDSTNRYVYNGEEHTVAGRGTPEFLSEEFAPVKLGDEKALLQVAHQFKPIFILDKSGTAVADVLSDVAKLDQINEASRLASKDRKDVRATRKVREKDVVDLRDQLASYENLGVTLKSVASLDEVERQVEAANAKATQLERFVEQASSTARGIKALSPAQTIQVPDISSLEKLGVKLGRLLDLGTRWVGQTAAVSKLEGVDQVVLPDLESFVLRGEKHSRLTLWAEGVASLKQFFAKVKNLSEAQIPDVECVAPVAAKYEKLALWDSSLKKLTTSLKATTTQFEQASSELDIVMSEFNELGVCPTCKRELGEHTEGQHA